MRGKELTSLERERIQWYLKGHWSLRDIGRALQRNHTVISRERKRNKKPDGSYSAVYAQQVCDKWCVCRGNVKRKLDAHLELQTFVVGQLKEGFSPDVIAGRLKITQPHYLQGIRICHESIYQWLYEGEGHLRGLWRHLPGKRQKRRHRGTRKKQTKTTSIPGRVSIHLRDEHIEERKSFGHWETDSMIYNKGTKQRLSVQTERKARYVMIHRLPSGKALDTLAAIQDSICQIPQDLWKSITWDNGSEGALHQKLIQDYDIQTFFCDPYSSWQKGSVENMNRLIRRSLPRSVDLSTISNQTIYDLQERLNNTPRKVLGYLTPKEVLFNLQPGVVH